MVVGGRVVDPLWQCLCPSWTHVSNRAATRILRVVSAQSTPRHATTPSIQHLRRRPVTNVSRRPLSSIPARSASTTAQSQTNPLPSTDDDLSDPAEAHSAEQESEVPQSFIEQLENASVPHLYWRLDRVAARGRIFKTRWIVEHLIKERKEAPNLRLYNALILANIAQTGAAWRVAELLNDLEQDGLQPDIATCHAILKVVSVHLDHLLQTDTLEYMRKRWFQLSEEGEHDVAAGLFREGRFEQALDRLYRMQNANIEVEEWLYDIAVYTLCEAGELEDAYKIVQFRLNHEHLAISKGVWSTLLDKGSQARHYKATLLAWTNQVKLGRINPPSMVCLNVLGTAARAGDATLGTEVLAQMSKHGSAFQRIHYTLLVEAYLGADPPDLRRAINVLTIMASVELEPGVSDTRALYHFLQKDPARVQEALGILRDLHHEGRPIPIAVLNLIIECHVDQDNMQDAMEVYKIIHTFAPIGQGAQKSFADIETFNLLLKGCRTTSPPDPKAASFLMSELLALRVVPEALTFDRLILVLAEACRSISQSIDESNASNARAEIAELLHWAFQNFEDMRSQGWMPRFGTIEALSVQLARAGDPRCWDVLQAASDQGDTIQGFRKKEHHVQRAVEIQWEQARSSLESARGQGQSEESDRVRGGLGA